MAGEFQSGEPRPVNVPIAIATSVNEGDLLATDSSTGIAYKASAQAWDTDLATTRAAFVLRFAGPSAQYKDANKNVLWMAGNPGTIKLNADGVATFACKAGTYRAGTLVGPAKQSGNALEDQLLEVVSSDAQAIGIVVGGAGVNPGVIDVKILSTVFKAAK